MHVDLPALPTGYQPARATESDIPAMLALLRSYEEGVTGSTSWTEGEVAEPFTTEKGRRDTAVVLAKDADRIAGYFQAHRDSAERWYGDATVALGLEETGRAALCGAGLSWVEQTALANADGADPVRMTHWCWAEDDAFARSLAGLGYEPVRAFIEMHLDLADRAPQSPNPEVAIRQADLTDLHGADARTVYEMISESFRDHYDYKERTFEQFMQRRTDGANADLDGWFIAEIDGRAAGATIHSNGYLADHNANYIDNLGTVRWARGKGVAKAMLEHSFQRAQRQGRAAVKLHVDAESPTGATTLYESVGMRRNKVGQEWQKFLHHSPDAVRATPLSGD